MHIPDWLLDLIGWIPGVVFPGASLLQLIAVIKSPHTDGVSITTWLMFALANIAAYVYLQKYWAPQAIAYLIAAVIQVAIAVVAYRKRNQGLAG